MLKYNMGNVGSTDGSKYADIIVKHNKKSVRDMVIGGAIAGIGITYMAITSFKNGANAFEQAEIDALAEVGVMDHVDVL